MIDAASIQIEIKELHQFFQAWFRAELPNTDAAFERFANAMAPDFRMIVPSGNIIECEPLLERLRGTYGAQPDLQIRLENVMVYWTKNETALATYEEWQSAESSISTARISTALFAKDASAPNGLKWLHVHETWMDS